MVFYDAHDDCIKLFNEQKIVHWKHRKVSLSVEMKWKLARSQLTVSLPQPNVRVANDEIQSSRPLDALKKLAQKDNV